jgi:hypothetical protein
MGASLTWPPPHEECSNQESEGEKAKQGLKFVIDSGRPSHGRVRFAAPNNGAPLTAKFDRSGPF